MSKWYEAPSLLALRAEVNARFPKRDKSSDGTIGDAAHSARESDHNPDSTSTPPGVVRAIDIDIDDNDAKADLRTLLLKAAIGDPRVWYVISNGIIYSRTYGWAARKYTGANGHFKHVHISLVHTHKAENDKSVWLDPVKAPPKTKPVAISLKHAADQFHNAAVGHPVKANNDVARIQRVLNAKYGRSLVVDGYAGSKTLAKYAAFESSHKGLYRKSVPDKVSLPILLRGTHYRMTA